MAVSILDPGESVEWEAYVDDYPKSSIYHSLAWKRVIQGTFGHEPILVVSRGKGNVIDGVLPLYHVHTVLGNRLVSAPLRDRGGVLYSNNEALRNILLFARQLCETRRCAYLEVKQFEETPGFVGLGFEQLAYWVTTIVELDPEPEKLWHTIDGKARGKVRQAIREGVGLKIAESFDDMVDFYRIFVETRHCLGIPAYPLQFFASIWDHLAVNGKARLLLATANDQTIAGILLLTYGDTVIDGYAASDSRYLSLRPNDFLIWKALEWSCQSGYAYFDFGTDSPLQDSLLAFKEKWGGRRKTVHSYYHLNRAKRIPLVDSDQPAYKFAREIWRTMPMFLFRLMGPLLTKQMS